MTISNLSSRFWSDRHDELFTQYETQRARMEFCQAQVSQKSGELESLKGRIRKIDPKLIGEERTANASWFKKLITDIFYKMSTMFAFVFGKLNTDLNQYRALSRDLIDLTSEVAILNRSMHKTWLEKNIAHGRFKKFEVDERRLHTALNAPSRSALFGHLQTLAPADVYLQMPLLSTLVHGASLISTIYGRITSTFAPRPSVVASSASNGANLEAMPLLPASPRDGSVADDDEFSVVSEAAHASAAVAQTPNNQFKASIKKYGILSGMEEDFAEFFADRFFPDATAFEELVQPDGGSKALITASFPQDMKIVTNIKGKAVEFVAKQKIEIEFDFASRKFVFKPNQFISRTPIGNFYITDLSVNDESLIMNGKNCRFFLLYPYQLQTLTLTRLGQCLIQQSFYQKLFNS